MFSEDAADSRSFLSILNSIPKREEKDGASNWPIWSEKVKSAFMEADQWDMVDGSEKRPAPRYDAERPVTQTVTVKKERTDEGLVGADSTASKARAMVAAGATTDSGSDSGPCRYF
jgi:hypothetical protein